MGLTITNNKPMGGELQKKRRSIGVGDRYSCTNSFSGVERKHALAFRVSLPISIVLA